MSLLTEVRGFGYAILQRCRAYGAERTCPPPARAESLGIHHGAALIDAASTVGRTNHILVEPENAVAFGTTGHIHPKVSDVFARNDPLATKIDMVCYAQRFFAAKPIPRSADMSGNATATNNPAPLALLGGCDENSTKAFAQ